MAAGGRRRLTVLGSCGAWTEPGRACSGFLLEYDGFRVVLDLGYATLPRLLGALGNPAADGLDAVVITHRHADHAIDLHGLFRARWFGDRGAPPLPLYAPRDVYDQLLSFDAEEADAIERVFDWHPLPAADHRVGPFGLQSFGLPHFVPNAGVRLSAPGLTVAYTGDTGPDPTLVELARDADLLIAEASDRDQQASTPSAPSGQRLHLDSRTAGQVAAEAGVRRLLLMHFWPGNDRDRSRAAAAAEYDGEILLADEDLAVDLR